MLISGSLSQQNDSQRFGTMMNPYQDKPDPWSSHSVIAAQLEYFPKGTRILDIGTASGTIGRICNGKDFILHGIEPVVEWAKVSRPYYAELLTQELQQTPDSFLTGQDVVICADVLEHMPDPDLQLKRLVTLQSEGSRFIISIPNNANLWIRLNLLFGNFDYTDRGILDKTHLRFFTQRTAKQMIVASGLKVLKIIPTPIPLPLVHPFFKDSALGIGLHRLLANLTKILPRLLGYQFVFIATKSSLLSEPAKGL